MALTDTQLGGGLFTGKAIYDATVFSGVREDVSDVVSLISPAETLLLNVIGDALYPAMNVFHEWQEEELSPNAVINSIAVASTAADTVITVKGGLGAFLQKGAILRGPEAAGGEYMQIVDNPSATSFTVTRAFSGTVANSYAIGEYLTVVADATTDGADVIRDVSRPRPRIGNYTQIFKKDVIIAGTQEAVAQHGGISSELDHQINRRLREALRDLEKAVILGRLSGNTIGTSALVRTMKGMLAHIVTNSVSVSSMGTDFGSTTMTFFEDQVNTAIRNAWIQGGTDLNLIVAGDAVKRRFDQLNNSRIRVVNEETAFRNAVGTYENTYGVYRVMLNRWMPTHMAAILASGRLAVTPLNQRSFHYEPVAKTGDAEKGMVLGEYTLEFRNEAGMASVSFNNLAPAAGQRLIQAP
jgi:hypothetical protein